MHSLLALLKRLLRYTIRTDPFFCMEVAPVTGLATSDPLTRCAELSRKPVELAVALSKKSGNFDITSLHVQIDVIVPANHTYFCQ